MEYSINLLINVLTEYNPWFWLYFTFYGISFFCLGIMILCTLFFGPYFVNEFYKAETEEKRLDKIMLTVIFTGIFICFFPRIEIFDFVKVKAKYTQAIKNHLQENINENTFNNSHLKVIYLLNEKINDKDDFSKLYKKELNKKIPAGLTLNENILEDAINENFKKCQKTTKPIKYFKEMKIGEIENEIHIDMVICARESINSLLKNNEEVKRLVERIKEN